MNKERMNNQQISDQQAPENGPDIPFEFFLEKPDLSLKARFVNPSKLEILELQGFLDPDIFLPLSRNF